MKRSYMVMMMARYYNLKNVMVESNYINATEFCSLMLQLVEDLGMSPPFNSDLYYKTWRQNGSGLEWEEEDE